MSSALIPPYSENSFGSSSGNHIFKILPVCIQTLQSNKVSNTHWHDYLQIWYTASGEYDHVIDGVTIPQKPGSVMLISPI
ncbi:MAG: AraC family ligand binding domain-containing protein [Oscillospiraceae bacterium]|nr:AraC family ligand binding domain-containing protein [Oscillospiraceae bacterium]